MRINEGGNKTRWRRGEEARRREKKGRKKEGKCRCVDGGDGKIAAKENVRKKEQKGGGGEENEQERIMRERKKRGTEQVSGK